MHKPPQIEVDASSVGVALLIGQAELAIPTLGNGDPARFVMISVNIESVVAVKVGLAGVDSDTDPHFYMNLSSGPIVINVTGQKAIDFTATEVGVAIVIPLSNQ